MAGNQKKAYSVLSNIGFSLRTFWQIHPILTIQSILGVVANVSVPFLSILLPKVVIDSLENHVDLSDFILKVGLISLGIAILMFLKMRYDFILDNTYGMYGVMHFLTRIYEKRMSLDYEQIEDPEIVKMQKQSEQRSSSNHSPAFNLLRDFYRLLIQILGFILYAYLLVRIHPILLLILFASSIISWIALRSIQKAEHSITDKRSYLYGKIRTLTKEMGGIQYGKDIRIYSLQKYLLETVLETGREQIHLLDKVGNRRLLSGLIDTLLILLRDSVAYFLLIRMLLSNTIELGDFVLTFAAVGTFSTWISGILEYGSSLNRGSDELGDIRVFFDLSNIPRSANTFEMESTPPEIEFDNVSFTYPGNDAPTLSHVSFLIPAGERFALVGKNGAGKTTIVKLMTGLYTPSEGTVRIGGVDISTLDRSVLFPKMSAVFQDIHLLADSIATNVAQAQNVDLDAMWKALEMADFAEKVRSFPLQENTQLVIQVNSDAINLSGGEMQKLAIARALYHDAPVLILDEPTAALDPISEDQVYQKYALLTQGKTSLFISHRLASTRFCDRILLLDGSQIIEEGTHEELLAKNGAYAEMFSIQASYYQEREGDILA